MLNARNPRRGHQLRARQHHQLRALHGHLLKSRRPHQRQSLVRMMATVMVVVTTPARIAGQARTLVATGVAAPGMRDARRSAVPAESATSAITQNFHSQDVQTGNKSRFQPHRGRDPTANSCAEMTTAVSLLMWVGRVDNIVTTVHSCEQGVLDVVIQIGIYSSKLVSNHSRGLCNAIATRANGKVVVLY